jgi:hypothetical protein
MHLQLYWYFLEYAKNDFQSFLANILYVDNSYLISICVYLLNSMEASFNFLFLLAQRDEEFNFLQYFPKDFYAVFNYNRRDSRLLFFSQFYVIGLD